MGLNAMATFSGSLAWPFVYPWPQRPAGLIDTAFDELARRWRPLLDVAEENGVDVCYEIHPGEDLFDGTTYEMFLEKCGNHARCCMLYDPSHYVLQCLDYLDNIDIYHERSTSRTRSSIRPGGRGSTRAMRRGWSERAGSAAPGTGRSTSARCSRS
jgi:sugar phosphate isomerase/epimerase